MNRKWKKFKMFKRGFISLWIFIILSFFSMTAEFWANDRPLILFYQGEILLPVIKNYHPSRFGLSQITTSYKEVKLSDNDWAIWPIIRWNPYESNSSVSQYPSKPTISNWMGTDQLGRDVFTRLLYGFRYSMGFAILFWLISFFLGTFAGMIMGFRAGWWDLLGQRFVEIFQSIPFLILLITVVSILGHYLWVLVLIASLFGWMNISLYIRSEFLKLRKKEFVQSAHAFGVGWLKTMIKHILPNALTPLVTFSPFKLAGGVSVLAVLDYLGFGLTAPTPSWGELLLQAEQHFLIGWWLALFPSLFLFLTLVSLMFIGEGVRFAFDHKKSISHT